MNNAIFLWQNSQSIDHAYHALTNNKAILSSTDTILGLATTLSDNGAHLLDTIKIRRDKPYLILIGSTEEAIPLIDPATIDAAHLLMRNCWPGPLTIITKSNPTVPSYATSGYNTIGLRLPAHAGLQRLISKTGPLFSTSANISSQPIPKTLTEVDPIIIQQVACIIVDSSEQEPTASTIIDCSGNHPTLIRPGAYPIEEIQEILRGQLRFSS